MEEELEEEQEEEIEEEEEEIEEEEEVRTAMGLASHVYRNSTDLIPALRRFFNEVEPQGFESSKAGFFFYLVWNLQEPVAVVPKTWRWTLNFWMFVDHDNYLLFLYLVCSWQLAQFHDRRRKSYQEKLWRHNLWCKKAWAQSDGSCCRQIEYFRWLNHLPVIQLCKQLRVFWFGKLICLAAPSSEMSRIWTWWIKVDKATDKIDCAIYISVKPCKALKAFDWSYHGSQVWQVFMEKVEGASKLYFEAWKVFVIPQQKSLQRFVRVDFGVKQPKKNLKHEHKFRKWRFCR